jgi:hypothetical protein
MKVRQFFFLSVIALFGLNDVFGQGYTETALLFSRTTPGGSSRIQALGGTQTALGGDYSSAYSNPAGLGMFNRSEFSFTPSSKSIQTKTLFYGTETTESVPKFQLPGFGAVFNIPSGRSEGAFIGGSFAITFNKTNDYNGSTIYSGANTETSIIQSFIAQANGDDTGQFFEGSPSLPPAYNYNTPVGLAYNNYLIGPASTIDPDFPNDEYFTDVQYNFSEYLSDAFQREEITTKGSSNQWNIAYGANFMDKIFVGGGIGISTIRYESKTLFSESYEVDPFFDNLTLEETLTIRGSGINATIGAMFRPVNFLQLGLSYSTPTFYQMTEKYDAYMTSNWKNFKYFENRDCEGNECDKVLTKESAGTDIVTSEYNLTLPSKLSAGFALISKFGFLSGDVEYTNPSNAKYTSDIDGISFREENDEIRSVLTSTFNYRVGAEYRLKMWRFRLGYSLQGNTFVNETDNQINTISGGVGVRMDKFYIDFALTHRSADSKYSPYAFFDDVNNRVVAPSVDVTRKITTGMITVGFTY